MRKVSGRKERIRRTGGILGMILLLCISGCSSDTGSQFMADFNESTAVESGAESEKSAESESGKYQESENVTEPVSVVVKAGEEVAAVSVGADSGFSVRFIDVGQADSALVECDGHYMLIDGGNKADSSLIYTVLKENEINHLDMVVGTHAHEDHIGGLPGALNYATADMTLSPVTDYDSKIFSDFKKYADLNGGGITVPEVGDAYELGSAEVKVLGVNGGSDTNDTSIVLKVIYGETSFLFAGDAERDAEQAILDSGADLSATVLKVGHHGSDTSTTYPFLREIMPEYAVISVGEGNSYGHPTEDTLSRLRDADVEVFRTDLQGDIICTSDGRNVSFTTERKADQNTVTDMETAAATYILNTGSEKFHVPSCSSVSKMSEKNKQEFTGTREEVIAMGYDPCGACNP